MMHRLPVIFCHHCGRSVPRAALRCLWCHAPSPLRPLRMPRAANRQAGIEAAEAPPPIPRRAGET
jgi:hypothetical protein